MRAVAYALFSLSGLIVLALAASAFFAVQTGSDFETPVVFFGSMNLAAVLAVGGLVLLGSRGR